MARKIVISADPYEARAALLDGDLLINLEIESAGSNRKKGNIYKGRVTTIEKGLEAAFVDYGTGKEGFLPLDEVNERSLVELTGKSPSASGHVSLGVGDIILVQVAKEEVGKKGAALTMNVSNPGRFLVLMPFSSRTGVSRKLAGDDRSRLKDALDRLSLPDGFGCIIRTVSDQSMDNELQADLDHLIGQWKDIVGRFREAKKPGEVYTESSLALRFIRDYMDTAVEDVIVEDDASWQELAAYFRSVMPGMLGVLTRYSGDLPLFVKFNVDRQVEALLRNKVILPSGGSIVIGQTEALTAIDVNSGRTKKGAIEDTAFKTNLEAAVEIARQVILRDIGGIIVVDFIDMEAEAHRKAVEDALRNALARDKAHLTVARIRDFGLLAFSRQRLRHTVEEGIMSSCPACGGTGRIRAPGPLAMSIMRRLRERLANMTSEAELVEVTVSVEVANFLNNRKREELIALERKHGLTIEILGTPDVAAEDMQLSIHEEIPEDRQLSRGRAEQHEEVMAAVPAAQPAAAPKPGEARVEQAPAPQPPKQKPSLLKGLIARLLDIEEFDEVPAREKNRQPAREPVQPAQRTEPQPAQRPEPRPATRPEFQPTPKSEAQPNQRAEVQPAARPSGGQTQPQAQGGEGQPGEGQKSRSGRQRQRSRKPKTAGGQQGQQPGQGQQPQQAAQPEVQQTGQQAAQQKTGGQQAGQQKSGGQPRQPRQPRQPAQQPAADQTKTAQNTPNVDAQPGAGDELPTTGEQPKKRSRSRHRGRGGKKPEQQQGQAQGGAEGQTDTADRHEVHAEPQPSPAEGQPDKPKAPRKRYRSRKPKAHGGGDTAGGQGEPGGTGGSGGSGGSGETN